MKLTRWLPCFLATTMMLSLAAVADAKFIKHNYCPSGEESIATKIRLAAETSQYYINICTALGSEDSNQYVGVSKANRRNNLYAPLVKEKPGFFVGANGVYRYVVDANVKELRVFKRNQLILKQKLYNIKYY